MGDTGTPHETVESFARQHHLDPVRVLSVVTALLETEPVQRDMISLHLVPLTERIGAAKALEFFEHKALEFHEHEDPLIQHCQCRQFYDDLFGRGREGKELPLLTLDELADQTDALVLHLHHNRISVQKTGLSRIMFRQNTWLGRHVRLYPLKQPYDQGWFINQDREIEYFYQWAPDLGKLALNEDGSLVMKNGAFSTVDNQPPDSPFCYEDAPYMEEFAEADAIRLERERARIFDLKIRILRELAEIVRGRKTECLRERCMALIAGELTASDVKFFLRMDSVYSGDDARTGERVGDRFFWGIGGLSDLFRLICHFETELRHKAFALAREELSRLPSRATCLPRYYDSVAEPWHAMRDTALLGLMTRLDHCDELGRDFQQWLDHEVAHRFGDNIVLRTNFQDMLEPLIRPYAKQWEAAFAMQRAMDRMGLKFATCHPSSCMTEETKHKHLLADPETHAGDEKDRAGGDPPPAPPTATVTDSGAAKQLKPCASIAYASYEYAMNEGKLSDPSDREVYDWLRKNAGKWLEDQGYTLPAFETWVRYVRTGRRAHGTQRNTLRAARPHGPSIVPIKQIEYQSSQSQRPLDEDNDDN